MKTVLLDCDGVMADFVGHLRNLLAQRGHVIGEVVEYDFLRGFGEVVGNIARELLKDPETWRTLPAYDEAIDGVDRIQHHARVAVVTSPWLSCREWTHARHAWLRREFDIEARDVIVTSAKELVRGDGFVDDRPETVEAWRLAHGAHGFVMDRPYNRNSHSHIPRFSWAPEHLDAFIADVCRKAA